MKTGIVAGQVWATKRLEELPAGVTISGGASRNGWLGLTPERHIRMSELLSTNDIPHRYPTPADLIARLLRRVRAHEARAGTAREPSQPGRLR